LDALSDYNDVETIDNDDVDDDDSEYGEQNNKQHYKITPYTSKSQQDYFGTVSKTTPDQSDEASVLSRSERAAQVGPGFKYSAAHTTFMEQQDGANMMQTLLRSTVCVRNIQKQNLE